MKLTEVHVYTAREQLSSKVRLDFLRHEQRIMFVCLFVFLSKESLLVSNVQPLVWYLVWFLGQMGVVNKIIQPFFIIQMSSNTEINNNNKMLDVCCMMKNTSRNVCLMNFSSLPRWWRTVPSWCNSKLIAELLSILFPTAVPLPSPSALPGTPSLASSHLPANSYSKAPVGNFYAHWVSTAPS